MLAREILDKGAAYMQDVKQAVLEIAQALPEGCNWDDVMYRIYVRQKIEAGLKDAEADKLHSHEVVHKEVEG